ncbi:MAG: SHOCT domain-containing protein [Anaerolineae bacterium]|nr:SHOCT domain-containing protein [Anaerolineae bacterium]
MARFGCLLMIVSFVVLCGLVVLPVIPFLEDTKAFDDLLQPLFCQKGETVVREQYQTTDRDGTSYSMDVYCVSEEGRRDVTAQWFLVGIVGFTAPFLIGLFAFIFGVNRGVRRVTVGGDTDILGGGRTVDLSSFMSPSQAATSSSGSSKSLSDKLKQIQEARDAGLITVDEYDRLRREILDEGI